MGVLGRAARRPPRPTRCASSAWPRCTRASPLPCGCSSASSGSTPPAPPRSPAAWPSPAGPFNHFVLQSLRRPRPAPARRAGGARPADDRVGHALQARARRLVGHAAREAGDLLLADLAAEAVAATEVVPVVDVAAGRDHPGHAWCRSRRPTAASRGSTPCAPPSWPTSPMGSAPPPPAKMQRPPASPSPKASSGAPSR